MHVTTTTEFLSVTRQNVYTLSARGAIIEFIDLDYTVFFYKKPVYKKPTTRIAKI